MALGDHNGDYFSGERTPTKSRESVANMKRPIGFWAGSAFISTLALLVISSCAVDGGAGGADGRAAPPPSTHEPMSAARLGLASSLRPFFDELEQYGDWILAEPQGWVFRPRVNTVAWRPYQDGHWEPSYVFGWVWESNDPFGWITDHYGFWFHDDFQGWVWKPYGAWAPAWVAWVRVGDFIGWAPLAPEGTTSYDKVPGGVFTYVPANGLAQRSAAIHASYVNSVPDDGSEIRPIDRVASYRGVYWNAGPDLGDVLGAAAADRLRLDQRDGAAPALAPRGPASESRSFDRSALEVRTQRVWTEARRELTVVRRARQAAKPDSQAPVTAPGRQEVQPRPAREPGASDSLGAAPGDSLRMRRVRRGAKPGAPTPPGSGND